MTDYREAVNKKNTAIFISKVIRGLKAGEGYSLKALRNTCMLNFGTTKYFVMSFISDQLNEDIYMENDYIYCRKSAQDEIVEVAEQEVEKTFQDLGLK